MWCWDGEELPLEVVAELEESGSISHREAKLQYERIARKLEDPWYVTILRALFPSLYRPQV